MEASAREALATGRHADAEDLARRLDDHARASGQSPLQRAAGRALLAEALLLGGRSTREEALAAAREAVAAAKAAFGPADLRTAAWQALLGRVLLDRGDRSAAREPLTAALDARTRALPRCAPEVLDSTEDLADLLLTQHEIEAAQREIVRAQACDDGQAEIGPGRRARLRELQARQQSEAGHYQDALLLADEARRLLEQAPANALALASTLNLLGELEWRRERLDRAQSWHQRALEISRAALGPGHPMVGTTLANLSLVERGAGNLGGAFRLEREALDVTLAARGEGHPETSYRLQDLASLHLEQDDYPQALELYERVMTLDEKRHGAHSDEVANVLYNRGLCRARMGDSARARADLERAVVIWEGLRGPDHPYLALPLDLLASLLQAEGELTQAEPRLARALMIRERAPDTRPVDLASTLARLGSVRLALGRREDARRHAARARDLCAPLQGQPQIAVAATLALIGDLDLALGQVAAASARFREALDMYVRLFGELHPRAARQRARLATGRLRAGHVRMAFRDAARAEEIRREQLRRTLRYLAEGQALRLAALPPEGRDVLLSIAAGRTTSAGEVGSAFEAVGLSRALVLDEMASRRTAPMPDALAQRLQVARQRLAYLLYYESDAPKAAGASSLAAARSELEALEREAAGRTAGGRAEEETRPLALALSSGLPPRSALVSYVRYVDAAVSSPAHAKREERYLAFVIRQGHPVPAVERLASAARIDGAIARWRTELEDVRGALADPVRAEARSRSVGEEIAQLLWRPLAPHLRGVEEVLIVPDGQIGLLSFAALPSAAGGYLVEHAPTLHYLSSERDVLRPDAVRGPSSLLALGGPDYEERPARSSDSTESRAATTGDASTWSPCASPGRLAFPFLPEAAAEARDIADMWKRVAPAPPPLLLTGSHAGEAALKCAAAGRGILHLATHGFFADPACVRAALATRGHGEPSEASNVLADNPLLQSGLALAGANHRRPPSDLEDDGLLTAAEVANLDLSAARLVVLSACGSGLGRIQAGEGVLSLQRAFVIAGASTVVMSLWSVDDVHARLWMRAFYEARLTGHSSTATAVQRAHRQLVKQLRREPRGAAPPVLWAAFVASGDWR